MPDVSSILGRGPHWRFNELFMFTARTASRIPATYHCSCHPHRDHDLHFEHPVTPNTLHPYDLYISFA
jgi:hypothetical protein